MILQKEIQISSKPRGFHIITNEIIENFPDLAIIKQGIFQIFIKHTSASLTVNEAADPSVRSDFEAHLNELVPEGKPYYKHTMEGSDDMPAHIKSSLIGSSILVPITNGTLNLGTWQGIYLCEHRNHGGSRTLILTVYGEK